MCILQLGNHLKTYLSQLFIPEPQLHTPPPAITTHTPRRLEESL